MKEEVYDRERPCSKCGHHPALVEVVDRNKGWRALASWGRSPLPPCEYRVLRTCPNCKFAWHELPLDYDAEREAAANEAYLNRANNPEVTDKA